MNFLKKNIVFTIVAVITILGSLFLIYLDWTRHVAISEANAVTQESQNKHNNAFKSGNKPVDLNIKMIHDDTAELRKRTSSLQRIFGKPYRKALLTFAASLKVSEDELYERMKKLYELPDKDLYTRMKKLVEASDDEFYKRMKPQFETDDGVVKKSADVLIPLLFADLENEKKLPKDSIKNNQFMKFVSDVFLDSVEKVDKNELIGTGYDILGTALGLQRTMSPSKAHVYLSRMQSEIRSRGLIPGVNSLETVQNFTFNQYVQTFPSNEAVIDILNTMPIFEDIFRRMRNSRLDRVEEFRRIAPPTKLNGDKYLSYEFSAKVVGTMDSVRNFLNNLLDAYKDNRVYVVTWVSMTSEGSTAEVEQLRNQLYGHETSNAQPGDDMAPPEEGRRRNSRRRRNSNRRPPVAGQTSSGRVFRILTEEEAEALPDYGQVRIGKNLNVTAVLRFKYYNYVGDSLKK